MSCGKFEHFSLDSEGFGGRDGVSRIFLIFCFLFIQCSSNLFFAEIGRSEEFVVGVVGLDREMNWENVHPASAELVRRSVFTTLTEIVSPATPAQAQPSFGLRLADSMRVSQDNLRWYFRIRRGAKFQSGTAILIDDVVFSLKRCTALRAVQLLVENIASGESHSAKDPWLNEEWVVITLSADKVGSGVFATQRLPGLLSECPIHQRTSSELFGEDFNRGANFVGSGAYRMVEFKAGKSVRLVFDRNAGLPNQAAAEAMTIRSFRDEETGLVALREGTVDILFVNSETLKPRVVNDETVAFGECRGNTFIRRQGFNPNCDEALDPSKFRRVG